MRHPKPESGASTLEYVMAASILFFVSVALLNLVNSSTRAYYDAATLGTGSERGLAPCGPHSALDPAKGECF
jgi:hypothetical protein